MTLQTRTPAAAPITDPGRARQSGHRHWRGAAVLVAAGLVSAALSAPASAQVRQEGAGRGLDANPRAGSAGRNDDGRVGRGPLVTGNQIVTGNVTAGRQFRGPVGYSDPGEFRA